MKTLELNKMGLAPMNETELKITNGGFMKAIGDDLGSLGGGFSGNGAGNGNTTNQIVGGTVVSVIILAILSLF